MVVMNIHLTDDEVSSSSSGLEKVNPSATRIRPLQCHLGLNFHKTHFVGNLCIVKGICVPNFETQNIFEEKIPTLYGKDIDKVQRHMDKASSHPSTSTAAYLAKKESETQE
ncbi:hypothetical protein TNCV_1744641 [Trichonephila clavipes]|nr:hypothetical protein TNCV_1744641 [Trichonephila clavipes]